jgi:rare lipoprotein A
MKRALAILITALFMAASMGAAPVPDPATPNYTPKSKIRNHPSQPYQVGNASWYGKQFHGKTTASGEDFDMFEMTAAHRQLPLGTYVKVTNLQNGKWIIVRINDRGPYVAHRIVDLSYGAARLLGFRRGVERVRLDLVQPETVAFSSTSGSR